MTDQPAPTFQPDTIVSAPGAPSPYEEFRASVPATLAAANEQPTAPTAPAVQAATAAPKHQPGPKPAYLVVESKLYAQTEEGEVVLDLRLPIPQLEKFMSAQDLNPEKIPRYVIDELLPESDAQRLLTMHDGAKAYAIVMTWAKEVGARLGASLGESQRSTDASESTEQPSAPISAPATT